MQERRVLKQMDLFGGPDLDPVAGAPAPAEAVAPVQPPAFLLAEDAADQFDLFGPAAAERRAIEELIDRGEFAEALARAEALTRERGAFFAVPDADCLRPLAELDWIQASRVQVQAAWRAARDSAQRDWRRQHVATAILRRHAGEPDLDLVGDDDVLLADVVAVRLRAGRLDLARLLVRDALLAGRALEPDAFGDVATRDVLREDHLPAVLACLGAIRCTWPTPCPADLSPVALEAPLPEDDHLRALEAWRCLSVALRVREMPPDAVIAARSRLRALNRELHALLMRE